MVVGMGAESRRLAVVGCHPETLIILIDDGAGHHRPLRVCVVHR